MKRLPIIRHIRWLIRSAQLRRWRTYWNRQGYAVNDKDVEMLHKIWRGEA